MIDASSVKGLAQAPTALDPASWIDAQATAKATRAAQARQVSGRRRLVDPTTCDRDYSDSEVEFMHAMQLYKARSGRMFPTWSEVLEVLRALGYEKPKGGTTSYPASPEGMAVGSGRVAQAG